MVRAVPGREGQREKERDLARLKAKVARVALATATANNIKFETCKLLVML